MSQIDAPLPPFEDPGSTPSAADSAGLVASVACAIHCAAMPLVIGYLPVLGLSWLADPSFHRVMAIVCFALALFAFLPGWRRHGSLAPALFGSVGVGLLAFAAFGLEGECCPACAAVKPTAEPEPVVTCTATDCVHCAAEASIADNSTPAPTTASLAWAIPLLTPLGGVFLIAGHVSNFRHSNVSCDKPCCAGASDDAEDELLG